MCEFKMKGRVCVKKHIALMIMAWGVAAMANRVQDQDIVFRVAGDVASAYINRGRTLNDGAVVQPSIDVSRRLSYDYGSVGFNFWGNMDIGRYYGTRQAAEFSEVDLSAYWAVMAFDVDWRFEYTQYLYPYLQSLYPAPGNPVTHELSVSLEKKFRELAVGGAAECNYIENRSWGTYMIGYGRYDWMVLDKLTLSPRVSVGFADNRMAESLGGIRAGFADCELRLEGNYVVNDRLQAYGRIGYVNTLDRNTLPRERYGTDVNFYMLAGVSFDM